MNDEFFKWYIDYEREKKEKEKEEIRRFSEILKYAANKKLGYLLAKKINNLSIKILDGEELPAVTLINNDKLEGWCWQTTEMIAPFMNNTTSIYRGDLFFNFDKNDPYHHAWLEFNYKNENYVFDPCLHLIVNAQSYHEIFEVYIRSVVESKKVKEEFKKILKDDEEVYIAGSSDINDVFFRTNASVKGLVRERKLKKLRAHYYYNE